MQYVRLHDVIAGLAALILLLGIISLVAMGKEVPDFVSHGFTIALGWLFRGGAQTANDLSHRNNKPNAP